MTLKTAKKQWIMTFKWLNDIRVKEKHLNVINAHFNKLFKNLLNYYDLIPTVLV